MCGGVWLTLPHLSMSHPSDGSCCSCTGMMGADLQGLPWGGAGRAEPELALCPTCSLKMQPTATMATEATTTATIALTTSWDNTTSRPTVGGDSWKWGWGGIERSPGALTHPIPCT